MRPILRLVFRHKSLVGLEFEPVVFVHKLTLNHLVIHSNNL